MLFVVREWVAEDPMMPLGLFRSRNFSIGNLSTLALYGAVPAATFFLVLFLQQVRGTSALGAGAVLLPTTVMIFLFAKRFGALADRFGPRLFMGVGPLVAAAGLGLLLTLNATGPYVATVVVGTTVLGLGLSMSVAALTATVLGSVRGRVPVLEHGPSGLRARRSSDPGRRQPSADRRCLAFPFG
jgi:predicted MFS family arabinose efflux permease